MKSKMVLMHGMLAILLLTGCGKSEDDPATDGLHVISIEADSGGEGAEQSDKTGEESTEGASNENGNGQPDKTGSGSEDGQSDKTGSGSEDGQSDKAGDGSGDGQQAGATQPVSGSEADFDFSMLSDRYFYFSSGAGGWSTELRIESDGKLKGSYHDSDMGDIGEGYPNGTLYFCNFTGQFGGLEKVDDHTYKMKLVSLEFEQEPETEEIIDDTLWIYSTAYGLDGGEDFYLYLPGSELAGLPEGYLQWVGYYNLESVSETTLPYYGLYNINTGDGFSSYEYREQNLSERITAEISYAEERGADLEARLQDEVTQEEMDTIAAELFQAWDDALNIVWKLLESGLDEEKMTALREEERAWIVYKEEAVKAAGLEYEGGSMQAVAESLKAADLTKERVYKLAEYAAD